MEKNFGRPFLTLEDLSNLADTRPANTTEDCSRRTVDWASTLLAQASLVAGMAGLRLTAPRVGEVYLIWQLRNAVLRARVSQPIRQEANSGQEGRQVHPHDFGILADIVSPADVPINERKIYAKVQVCGRFTPQFVVPSLLSWFNMPPPEKSMPRLKAFLDPVYPWVKNPGPEKEFGVWFSPDETRDIHEVVREAFVRLEGEGIRIEFAGLTFEQMAQLRDDWDGRGAPPPSDETVEWAKIAFENLTHAANTMGIGMRKPLTQLFSIVPGAGGPPEVSIALRCLLWSNLLMVFVRTEPGQHAALVSLDFDRHLDRQSGRGWLTMEFTVLREQGKSPAETLRELLWWRDSTHSE